MHPALISGYFCHMRQAISRPDQDKGYWKRYSGKGMTVQEVGPASQALSDRAQELLKTLVQLYIKDGHPVGSRTLVQEAELSMSSATVRNVLAELQRKGFLVSPHTSSGRVPTPVGYRFFVDSLPLLESPDEVELSGYRSALDPDLSSHQLVEKASGALSELTHKVGVVTLPKQGLNSLRRTEFLPLSGDRVLVILVLHGHEVQSRIIHTRKTYREQQLREVSNYINRQYAGKPPGSIAGLLRQAIQEDRLRLDKLLEAVLDLATSAFQEEERLEDCVIAGQENLLGDDQALEELRELFHAFSLKVDILDLLDRCLAVDGVHLFIGEESGYRMLGDCSVVTAPYKVEGQRLGVLGVIGPTRMAYTRVIPIVEATARILGTALGNSRQ